MNSILKRLGLSHKSKPAKKLRRTQLTVLLVNEYGEVISSSNVDPSKKDEAIAEGFNNPLVKHINIVMLNGRTKAIARATT